MPNVNGILEVAIYAADPQRKAAFYRRIFGFDILLESAGVAIESRVNWLGGATSLYFRDPDDHAVELITPGFWRNY